jgi:diadenosine tetraphosphate (Ap4A) HIT family hydrolase
VRDLRTLQEVTESDLVYVKVFGERIAHLHFNLAPHRKGDALRGGPAMVDPGAQPLAVNDLTSTAARIRAAMTLSPTR